MKHLLCYILFLLVNVAAWAEVIDCTPGELRALVGNPSAVTSLTVTGEMDVTDFDFIAEQMPNLYSLTIDARIAPYKGAATRNGAGVSAEGMLPDYALFGSAVKELVIGSNTHSIGEAALAGSSLEKVTISGDVTAIPPYMAKGAVALRHLSLPASVKMIGEGAFEGCTSLESVDASGVTVIDRDAFKGCSSLITFRFSNGLTSIGESAFAATGLTQLDLRGMTSLKNIGKRGFAECENLVSVALPEGLTTLPEGMLFGDTSISTLILPTTLVSLETLSLAGLSSLNMAENDNVIASTAIERVGDYALANWESTKKIRLPETVAYLGDRAMQQWGSLTFIAVPEGMAAVPELGEKVWENTPQGNIILQAGSTSLAEAFGAAPQWQEFIITDINSVESTVADESSLKVTTEGSEITLACTEIMADAMIYDLAGRILASSTPRSATVTLTTGAETSALIIRVKTETDKIFIKKIIRK